MKKLLIILLCICSPLVMAKKVGGEGRFFAYEDDSLKFINDQLLVAAFHNAVDKEMRSMGLDADKFWQKFEEKFEESVTPLRENLQKKHGLFVEAPKEGEEGKDTETTEPAKPIDPKAKENFDKEYRVKKLKLRSKLGSFGRAVKSYSIRKKSRATRSASSRFLILEASVDRKQVNSIYQYFTRSGKSKQFAQTFLSVNYELIKTGWEELGVEKSTDFTKVLEQHWKQWLEDNFKNHIGEVVISDASRNKMLQDYTLKMSQGQQGNDGSMVVGTDFPDSAWLKIDLQIRRADDNEKSNERVYEFSSKYIAIDLESFEIVKSDDFPRSEKEFKFKDNHSLSSSIASHVYQIPLQSMLDMRTVLAKLPMDSSQFVVEVENLTTIKDLIRINDLLVDKGVTLDLRSSIKTYSGEKGVLSLTYSGKREDLEKILLKIDMKERVGEKMITFPNKDNLNFLMLKYSKEMNNNSSRRGATADGDNV